MYDYILFLCDIMVYCNTSIVYNCVPNIRDGYLCRPFIKVRVVKNS